MQLGLGIDTGGTYTDSVLYDFSTGHVVARAKSLTTKNDLSEGIIASLGSLPALLLPRTSLVSLSTTLATNACVEGKGSRGKLILMGYDDNILKKLGRQYGLPALEEIILLPGSHGQQGQVVEVPDWQVLKERIMACSTDIDAFGIVEYWGVRNPVFEQQAKQYIREWTDKPVVSAHELSGEINSLRRASTTLLNARLITLNDQLLKAVKVGLRRMGIDAPVMVVKGDGNLMSEAYAGERPVETLLSGPAASVVGGMKLTGCRDALILDIGGTTSDLAVIRDGLAVLAEDGVDVSGWRTGTRAIKVSTIGLGGDSQISFDKNEAITIGPRKAAPLAWMAFRWPRIKERLRAIHAEARWHTLSLAEFFYIIAQPDQYQALDDEEGRILEVLKDGPEALEDLAEAVGTRPYFLKTDRLENLGIIGRGALTPTDLMHLGGTYTAWDREASTLGAEVLAARLGVTAHDLVQSVFREIESRLFLLIADYLLKRNIRFKDPAAPDTVSILRMAAEHPYEEIQHYVKTPLPIIGIGAPAHIFLPNVAKTLDTNVILSEDAGVANAVGAITGSIIGQESILIKPHYETTGISGYGCHGSGSYYETNDYEDALRWAEETAGQEALHQARAMGSQDVEVEVFLHENKVSPRDSGEGLLLETVVKARAIGSQAIYAIKN